MRKPIFSQLDEYKGDPLTEYCKIDQLITRKPSIYSNSLSDVFDACFTLSQKMRGYYVDYDDCIKRNTKQLSENRKNIYANLPSDTQSAVTKEFLNYCEIIVNLQAISCLPTSYYKRRLFHLEDEAYYQLAEMIQNSLRSIGYGLVKQNEGGANVFVVVKTNPEAECVAKAAPKTIRAAIYEYLGSRDGDLEAKETALHHLVDHLEPTLKKYQTVDFIGKIKKYSQLIRHPDTKQEEKAYLWFTKDKEEHLDELFDMCIFVESYVQTKENLKKFADLEKKTTSSN